MSRLCNLFQVHGVGVQHVALGLPLVDGLYHGLSQEVQHNQLTELKGQCHKIIVLILHHGLSQEDQHHQLTKLKGQCHKIIVLILHMASASRSSTNKQLTKLK